MKYGLPPLGPDAREIFCQGDHALFPDIPEITPIERMPDSHRYIGPVLWNPDVALPHWWDSVGDDRPIVYVNLGSSGNPSLLDDVLEALAPLNVWVLAATAGFAEPASCPGNTYLARFLPGLRAAKRARLVICNGGSMPVLQALSAGTPVIGLTSNLDQELFMRLVVRAGAGETVKARAVDASSLRRLAWRLLVHEPYRDSSRRLAAVLVARECGSSFRRFVDEVLPGRAVGRTV